MSDFPHAITRVCVFTVVCERIRALLYLLRCLRTVVVVLNNKYMSNLYALIRL